MKFHSLPVFAYGSLLNIRSFERTLGRRYNAQRIVAIAAGWRRAWTAVMPNEGYFEQTSTGRLMPERIRYLNLRQCADSDLNGVLYQLDEQELKLLDARELGYDRIVVDWALPDTSSRGQAYLYVASPEWVCEQSQPRSSAAVRKTYVDAVEEGVESLGAGFRAGYDASTEPLDPASIIYDELDGDVFEI
jgi:gamma-glutamylcyclotransferase (GGCT)/AIG2-like uncharacterized protein YtfP